MILVPVKYKTKRVCKLKNRNNFPECNQKSLSLAMSKVFDGFLLNDAKVKSEAEIEVLEDGYHVKQSSTIRALTKRITIKGKKEKTLFGSCNCLDNECKN